MKTGFIKIETIFRRKHTNIEVAQVKQVIYHNIDKKSEETIWSTDTDMGDEARKREAESVPSKEACILSQSPWSVHCYRLIIL